MIEVNSLHTQLTETLLESLDIEVRAELLDVIDTIAFVNRLINPNRLRAKDRPRDADGKIIVDITNPHILDDMDYFRQSAIHYQNNGNYTSLHPSSVPTSEYMKFWKEEARRCREGMIRVSDGEWIPGMYYWYLNYSPIMKAKTKVGRRKADWVQGFPDTYDGDYWYFHYIDQAQENGQHAMILKRRGCGCSYKAAASLARLFVLGSSDISKKMVRGFALANEKEYLIRDGVLNKFVDHIDWVAKSTPWPRIRLKDSLNEMHWKMGFKERESNTEGGTENEIIGVSLMNDPDRARGKRGSYIYWEEVGKFPNVLKAWQVARPSVEAGDFAHGCMVGYGCVCAGTRVWNNNGTLVNIEDLVVTDGILGFDGEGVSKEVISYWQRPIQKRCYKVVTNTGRFLECSEDHPILWSRKNFGSNPRRKDNKNKRLFLKKVIFKDAKDINIGDQIAVIESVPLWGDNTIYEPRVVGWLIGDGSYGKWRPVRLSSCNKEVLTYLDDNFNCKDDIRHTHLTKTGLLYREVNLLDWKNILKEIGVYGQVKDNKRLPNNIQQYCKNDVCELLGGLFDTDGSIGDHGINLTSISYNLLDDVRFLLQKLGIHANINKVVNKWHKNSVCTKHNDGVGKTSVYFKLEIGDKRSVLAFFNAITFKVNYKQTSLCNLVNWFSDKKERSSKNIKGLRFERVVSVEYIGVRDVYNLHANCTNTYIANGIVTHNTGGATGADFKGAEEFFYKSAGYNIFAIPNVFDRNINGVSNCGFFFPAYLDREGCYDENGNSDVIKSLIKVLNHRVEIKYQTSDPNSVVQDKAENPITPQEAVLRREGSMFPILDLKDYLSEVSPDIPRFTQLHYMGRFKLDSSGNVEWSNDQQHAVIREYPLKEDTDKVGCVELFEMPKRNNEGKVPRGRYIGGIDPIDYDSPFGTGSLGSIFIFDLWTDRIVAEYSGRPQRATDFYETCLRLLKFYNAEANYENNLKGLFAYFDQNHALHYLCDSPQVLRDMDFVKGDSLFGNKSKGTSASKGINSWGRKLQADWMITDAYSVGGETEEKDENGKVIEVKKKKNLHTIGSIGYLKEAISWSQDVNADRVSAMGMAMMLREDRLKYEKDRKDLHANTIFDDKWFKRTYQKIGPGYNRLLLPKKKKRFDYY